MDGAKVWDSVASGRQTLEKVGVGRSLVSAGVGFRWITQSLGQIAEIVESVNVY